eukprot:6449062-Alexandrium_andersonii.AAC.1
MVHVGRRQRRRRRRRPVVHRNGGAFALDTAVRVRWVRAGYALAGQRQGSGRLARPQNNGLQLSCGPGGSSCLLYTCPSPRD